MSKKVYILMGNPDMDTLSNAMADAYEEAALAAGHEVRRHNLPEMRFDPILHKGYKVIQELEPDLKTFQENVKWCNHFVIVYPNWWCTTPALLKGLFDRAWLPHFAFNMWDNGLGWTPRLKGRSARIIMLANSSPLLQWFLFGEFTNELARATVGFSGIAPVKIKIFYPSEHAPKEKIAAWMKTVRGMARKAD